MSNKKKRQNNSKPDLISRYDNYLAALLVSLVAVVTFLLQVTMINYTSPRLIAPLLDTGLQADIFSKWKLLFVLILAIVAVVILGGKIIAGRYELRASYLNLPLLLLVVLILLSTLNADYKSIALWGLYNQGTGALILLAYLALCLAAANMAFPPWFSRGLTAALLVVATANFVILLTHFIGHDITRLPAIKALLASPDMQQNLSGQVKSTLGNPNYISGLAASMCAYFSAGMLLKPGWRQKAIYISAVLASFAMILASYFSML